MIELMFVNGSWVHDSYKKRLTAFLQRVEERFSPRSASPAPFKSLLTSDLLERMDVEPTQVISAVFQKCPRGISQIMSPEDVDFFLHICKTLGKPVNFIPVIDKDLSFWFKVIVKHRRCSLQTERLTLVFRGLGSCSSTRSTTSYDSPESSDCQIHCQSQRTHRRTSRKYGERNDLRYFAKQLTNHK